MTPLKAKRLLTAAFLASALPLLLVALFPAQLDLVMDGASYLVFHNLAEFFSIMVSLSVFGVGWFTYDQSKDRHALFLGTAFLATGLIDFMHTLSSAAMPAFITVNSTNKSSQYWVAARLLDSSLLLASAFVHPHRPLPWLGKRSLLTGALAIAGGVFTAVTFFPAHLPSTFVPGAGLTTFKVASEYVVIGFLLLALTAYWRRMVRTADPLLVHYMAAFVIGIFGEAAFASYKVDFGTHNLLGHIYKVVAFYLIYRGAFAAAAEKPYLQLSDANAQLRREVSERQEAEEKVRALNAALEQRVQERTARLEAANGELEASREEARAHAVQLEAILDCVADGVIVYDREGRTLRSTPAADRILGGRGAELVVVLPAAAAPVRTVAGEQSRSPQRPRRVLVVDDNRDGAESLAQVVEMLGHAAQVAYDGPSALELASADPPEIILCDIGLPGMSGYEVARALRATSAELKLIAVSGYARKEEVQRAVEAGFDGHLAKPVDVADIEQLLA